MHNQSYVGRIALCTRKKLLKSGGTVKLKVPYFATYGLFVHCLFVHCLFVHCLFVHCLFVHCLFVHCLFVHCLFVHWYSMRTSSIQNEDLSTEKPAFERVCSNPRLIYYYNDETIPFQSFLCRLGFSPFFMKFYEKKNFEKNYEKNLCIQILIIYLREGKIFILY